MSIAGTSILGTLGSIAGNALSGSQSAGGSISNAGGSNWGYNTAQSVNRSQSSGYSNTYGTAASNRAANAAAVANDVTHKWYDKAMKYNAQQAQIQREWQERMANTIYTRSVQNMKEAGINPILAASMGLSGASVGSGATASISTPSAFMGQTFADTNSANQAWSAGDSFSHGENGGSWGSTSSSWNNSESGLATGLKQMADFTQDLVATANAGKAIDWLKEKLESDYSEWSENAKNDPSNTAKEQALAENDKMLGYMIEKFKGFLHNNGLGTINSILPFGPYNSMTNEEWEKKAKAAGLNEKQIKELRNALQ